MSVRPSSVRSPVRSGPAPAAAAKSPSTLASTQPLPNALAVASPISPPVISMNWSELPLSPPSVPVPSSHSSVSPSSPDLNRKISDIWSEIHKAAAEKKAAKAQSPSAKTSVAAILSQSGRPSASSSGRSKSKAASSPAKQANKGNKTSTPKKSSTIHASTPAAPSAAVVSSLLPVHHSQEVQTDPDPSLGLQDLQADAAAETEIEQQTEADSELPNRPTAALSAASSTSGPSSASSPLSEGKASPDAAASPASPNANSAPNIPIIALPSSAITSPPASALSPEADDPPDDPSLPLASRCASAFDWLMRHLKSVEEPLYVPQWFLATDAESIQSEEMQRYREIYLKLVQSWAEKRDKAKAEKEKQKEKEKEKEAEMRRKSPRTLHFSGMAVAVEIEKKSPRRLDVKSTVSNREDYINLDEEIRKSSQEQSNQVFEEKQDHEADEEVKGLVDSDPTESKPAGLRPLDVESPPSLLSPAPDPAPRSTSSDSSYYAPSAPRSPLSPSSAAPFSITLPTASIPLSIQRPMEVLEAAQPFQPPTLPPLPFTAGERFLVLQRINSEYLLAQNLHTLAIGFVPSRCFSSQVAFGRSVSMSSDFSTDPAFNAPQPFQSIAAYPASPSSVRTAPTVQYQPWNPMSAAPLSPFNPHSHPQHPHMHSDYQSFHPSSMPQPSQYHAASPQFLPSVHMHPSIGPSGHSPFHPPTHSAPPATHSASIATPLAAPASAPVPVSATASPPFPLHIQSHTEAAISVESSAVTEKPEFDIQSKKAPSIAAASEQAAAPAPVAAAQETKPTVPSSEAKSEPATAPPASAGEKSAADPTPASSSSSAQDSAPVSSPPTDPQPAQSSPVSAAPSSSSDSSAAASKPQPLSRPEETKILETSKRKDSLPMITIAIPSMPDNAEEIKVEPVKAENNAKQQPEAAAAADASSSSLSAPRRLPAKRRSLSHGDSLSLMSAVAAAAKSGMTEGDKSPAEWDRPPSRSRRSSIVRGPATLAPPGQEPAPQPTEIKSEVVPMAMLDRSGASNSRRNSFSTPVTGSPGPLPRSRSSSFSRASPPPAPVLAQPTSLPNEPKLSPAEHLKYLHALTSFANLREKNPNLMKFGHRGRPHKTEIKIQDGFLYWNWESWKENSPSRKYINLATVESITLGRFSALLQTKTSPVIEQQCFTIVAADRELNFQAKNNDEASIWVNGLMAMVELLKAIRANMPQEFPPAKKEEVDSF